MAVAELFSPGTRSIAPLLCEWLPRSAALCDFNGINVVSDHRHVDAVVMWCFSKLVSMLLVVFVHDRMLAVMASDIRYFSVVCVWTIPASKETVPRRTL